MSFCWVHLVLDTEHVRILESLLCFFFRLLFFLLHLWFLDLELEKSPYPVSSCLFSLIKDFFQRDGGAASLLGISSQVFISWPLDKVLRVRGLELCSSWRPDSFVSLDGLSYFAATTTIYCVPVAWADVGGWVHIGRAMLVDISERREAESILT